MQLKNLVIVNSLVLITGCAANHTSPEPRLTALDVTPQQEVCSPRKVDRAVELDDTCVNKVKRSATAGKGYKAVGRDYKSEPSICRRTFLPKCRRKY